MKKTKQIRPREFRRNNARTGHPSYIISIEKHKPTKVKFIGITSSSTTHNEKNIELNNNPIEKNT